MALWLMTAVLLVIAVAGVFYFLLWIGVIRGDCERSPAEVVRYIEDFVSGSGGERDWDDFTSVPIRDPRLDAIRLRCSQIADSHPPEVTGEWCSAEGRKLLLGIAAEIDLDAA